MIRYSETHGYDRRVYRLHRHGKFIGEYKTPEELGKVVDLATLVEEEGRPDQPEAPPASPLNRRA